GDYNACAPAAVANGMKWLSDKHPEARVNQSERERLNEISGLMGRWYLAPTPIAGMIQGKLRYILRHKLKVVVKFQSRLYKNGKKIWVKDDADQLHKDGEVKDKNQKPIISTRETELTFKEEKRTVLRGPRRDTITVPVVTGFDDKNYTAVIEDAIAQSVDTSV